MHARGSLLNIVTGQVASIGVNVDNPVEIGKSLMIEFETSGPERLYTS